MERKLLRRGTANRWFRSGVAVRRCVWCEVCWTDDCDFSLFVSRARCTSAYCRMSRRSWLPNSLAMDDRVFCIRCVRAFVYRDVEAQDEVNAQELVTRECV